MSRLCWSLAVLMVACSPADEAPPSGAPGDVPGAGAEPEGEGDPEPEADPGADPDPDVAPDPDPEGDPEPGPAPEPDPDPEPEPAGDDEFNTEGACCVDGEGEDVDPPEGEEPPPAEEPEAPEPGTVDACFVEITGEIGPDYDQYQPVVGEHCAGTAHQQVQGVEKVVFLGDSVTAGTPPTMFWDYYWVRLAEQLKGAFGQDLEITNCAKWGARTDDLLIGKREIAECFPDGGSDKVTLVVMTVGGNDISAWAQDRLSAEEALSQADAAADLLDDSVRWLKDPANFPNGSYVVYANPYEYTDATGDVDSCPFAAFAGLGGNWIEGAPAVIRLHERFMQIAVETGSDMAFALESFCGHGFHHDDPASQCYRGPDAELWFDLTCIHPNPAGHAVLADLFARTIGI